MKIVRPAGAIGSFFVDRKTELVNTYVDFERLCNHRVWDADERR
jgi:hypothetical protein